jgi:hypothetical protein
LRLVPRSSLFSFCNGSEWSAFANALQTGDHLQAALAALRRMASTAASASAAVICNDEGDCTRRGGTVTVPNSISRSIRTGGSGLRPTMENIIVGVSIKAPAIGVAASGSDSKRRSLERNLSRTCSLTQSFGKDARPSPEPIARSGKRRREPDIRSGFFFAFCAASVVTVRRSPASTPVAAAND